MLFHLSIKSSKARTIVATSPSVRSLESLQHLSQLYTCTTFTHSQSGYGLSARKPVYITWSTSQDTLVPTGGIDLHRRGLLSQSWKPILDFLTALRSLSTFETCKNRIRNFYQSPQTLTRSYTHSTSIDPPIIVFLPDHHSQRTGTTFSLANFDRARRKTFRGVGKKRRKVIIDMNK